MIPGIRQSMAELYAQDDGRISRGGELVVLRILAEIRSYPGELWYFAYIINLCWPESPAGCGADVQDRKRTSGMDPAGLLYG